MVGLVLEADLMVVLETRMMAAVLMVRVMCVVGYFDRILGYLVTVVGEVLVSELMVEVSLAERWTAAAVTAVAS